MENVPHPVVIIKTIYPLCTQVFMQSLFTLLFFQMAEEEWTQGICQAAPSFPSLLINALESLGVSECPRYYSREYEHRCKDHRGVQP